MAVDQVERAGHLTFMQRLKLFTPTVAFLTFYLSLATLNFGYDVGKIYRHFFIQTC